MEGHENSFIRIQSNRNARRAQHDFENTIITKNTHPNNTQSTKAAIVRHESLPHRRVVTENLKQWELVEDGKKGLQVVEKKNPSYDLEYDRYPAISSKGSQAISNLPPDLEEKLKVFKDSKIIQPIRVPAYESPLPNRARTSSAITTTTITATTPTAAAAAAAAAVTSTAASPDITSKRKMPINLEVILKPSKDVRKIIESTDMLQNLEKQVKAIEMDTIAARNHAVINSSTNFGNDIQLRYKEHEDLLENMTDDETEGLTSSRLQRGSTTRNSTGNTKIMAKKPVVKLSRTASDTRRGQGAELSLRTQSRAQQVRGLIKPTVPKKEQRQPMQQQQQQQQQSQPQNTTLTSLLRPPSDNVQRQNEKEVHLSDK